MDIWGLFQGIIRVGRNNMKQKHIVVYIFFIPATIILLIGLYMKTQNITSTGIWTGRHSGGTTTISANHAIAIGLLFYLVSTIVFFWGWYDRVRRGKLLYEEAKRAMTGNARNSVKYEFYKLLAQFKVESKLTDSLWNELAGKYSENHRKYHTLKHLEHLFELLNELKWEIKNWNALSFAIFYHDVIYDASRNDNEEQSAKFAERRMHNLHLDSELIFQVKELILATKTHECDENSDAAVFLDADLSVLGETEERYKLYSEMIRTEFIIYPDSLYNPGRLKVLEHFLAKQTIYKTNSFRRRFEKQARENLENEIRQLKSWLES